MAQLTISNSAQLHVPANVFVEAIYLVSAPTVLIQAITPTKGGTVPYYPNPFQVVFVGLTQGSLYRVILYESSDGTPSGEVRCSMDIDANGQTVTLRDDLHIYGGDPGADADQPTYVDTSLVGWNYSLEEVGTGTLDSTNRPVVTINNTGGWTLTDGENIQQNQHFVMHFQPQISVSVPSTPSLVNSGQIISIDTTLDQTYLNQALYLRGTNSNFIITLPELALVGDYQQAIFYSDGGSHISVTIQCATGVSGDMIYRKIPVSEIVLCQDEYLTLFKANGVWNVKEISASVDMVGQIIYSYCSSLPGFLPHNGTQVSIVDYPRIYGFLNNNSLLIPLINWNNLDVNNNYPNRGKYAIGTGITANSLQLPYAPNGDYFQAINTISGRSGGDFIPDGVGDFNAKITGRISQRSGGDNKILVLSAKDGVDFGPGQSSALPVDGDSDTTHPRSTGIFVHVRY